MSSVVKALSKWELLAEVRSEKDEGGDGEEGG